VPPPRAPAAARAAPSPRPWRSRPRGARCPGGEDGDAGLAGAAEAGLQPRQLRELHVGVAALAERVGQRLDLAERRAQLLAREARFVDLQRRAQPARRDAHVVDVLDVRHVEHAVGMLEQLAGAHVDRPRRRLAVGHLGIELDVRSLRHQSA
jgi:hypothetical protein